MSCPDDDKDSVTLRYQILKLSNPFFIPLGEKAIIDIWVVLKAPVQDRAEPGSIAPFPRVYDIREHGLYHLEVLERLLQKRLILLGIHIGKEAELIFNRLQKDHFFFILLSLVEEVLIDAVLGIEPHFLEFKKYKR